MERVCEYCMKPFTARRAAARFCSRPCLFASMRRAASVECAQCGRAYTRKPWELGRPGTRFCGRECFYRSLMGRPRPDMLKAPEERTCPVCGRAFLVGGRGRPPRRQVLCSDACQQRSRYRRGSQTAELSAVDAAYLAGFWDGEGSIILGWRRDHVAVKMSITNCDRAALEWIAETTALSVVHAHRPDTERTRATWVWQVHSDAAESVLRQIRPYLKVKATQADLAIATQERLRDPALKADRTWQQEWREQMRELNRRGPRPTTSTYELTFSSGG